MKNLNIALPSVEEVEKYLCIWETADEYEKYRCQEKSVVMMFREKFPENTKIEETLVKVAVLNEFYRTSILDIFSVALHIVDLNIDNMLAEEDIHVIDKIARITIGGKEKHFYSFATKYCSHHQPDKFPIYDRLVSDLLIYFNSQEKFFTIENAKNLRDYPTFKAAMNGFRTYFHLEKFTLKELDRYLWVLGRKIFSPKKEK
ncbi:MAG: hypothetical protein LBE91_00360 [Tannerella sp.]|jgi:hypothetical protein|nr:hypothetical protein [Tannerella sp.]